jgi:hypothetical protein
VVLNTRFFCIGYFPKIDTPRAITRSAISCNLEVRLDVLQLPRPGAGDRLEEGQLEPAEFGYARLTRYKNYKTTYSTPPLPPPPPPSYLPVVALAGGRDAGDDSAKRLRVLLSRRPLARLSAPAPPSAPCCALIFFPFLPNAAPYETAHGQETNRVGQV